MNPNNEQDEKIVIGAALIQPSLMAQAMELQPQDFYWQFARKAFVVMVEMYEAGADIDSLSVSRAPDSAPLSYLTSCVSEAFSIAGIKGSIQRLKALAHLRRINQIAETLQTRVSEGDTADELLSVAEEAFSELRKQVGGKAKAFRNLTEIDVEAGKEFERLHRGDSSAIPTFFPALDRVTRGGIQPGDVWVIASLTGRGKSSWALGAARMQAASKIPVAFVSREMSDYENYVRMLCAASKVPMWRVKPGMFPDTYDTLNDWRQPVSELPIYMNSSTANIFELRPLVRELVKTQGVRALFIDYLQLMSVNAETKNNTRAQEVAMVSRVLKEIAMENQIGVFALAQFNRGGAFNEHPELHHLAESSGIEKDASLVLILDMPQPKEQETNRECKMRIAKHRNGPLLSLAYTYRGDILSFEEAA